MQFKQRTLMQIANMICGNFSESESFFTYRSSSRMTEFFQDCDTDYSHYGSTRNYWVAETLKCILAEPQANAIAPPETFGRVICTLMDQGDALHEGSERPGALSLSNATLVREGFEAFYGPDKKCYFRCHIATNTIASTMANPHRPFSEVELKRREQLFLYLDRSSEDDLIAEVLLPLFRQLGFHRVTSAGHADKALEYGKDVWMKDTLPTQHVLYFGIQVKRGSSIQQVSRRDRMPMLRRYQVTMMLGHEIFDPEIGKRVLVDHAFIVAGGEITKAVRRSVTS